MRYHGNQVTRVDRITTRDPRVNALSCISPDPIQVATFEPGLDQMRCQDLNCSRVIFMGGAKRKPEYKPKNLKGRMLTLGINVVSKAPSIEILNN